MRTADIRRKIAQGSITPTPTSKADNSPMCLAWHTIGQCNANCTRSNDHVAYSAEDYQPLVEWCAQHSPTADS